MTLEESSRRKAREREIIKNNLKMLRDAGVRILPYEAGTGTLVERGIKVARTKGEFYIALSQPEPGVGVGYHYHDVCRKPSGLALKVASNSSDVPYVTLSNGTVYHFFGTYPLDSGEKWHSFNANYVKALNSRC